MNLVIGHEDTQQRMMKLDGNVWVKFVQQIKQSSSYLLHIWNFIYWEDWQVFYHYLFICLTPTHLTSMNKRTSEISAKSLLSGCAAELLLHDSALWMPPPFNGKHIPHCKRWSREILLQVTNWTAEIPLYSCLVLLLRTELVHWVSQLRDYYFNRWNHLVLQNWRLFQCPDKYEAIL